MKNKGFVILECGFRNDDAIETKPQVIPKSTFQNPKSNNYGANLRFFYHKRQKFVDFQKNQQKVLNCAVIVGSGLSIRP